MRCICLQLLARTAFWFRPVEGWGPELWEVPKNGKLGTTSECVPQYNESGSVRHECDLQGVITSQAVHSLRCADVHVCTCIKHEKTRKTAGWTTEEPTDKFQNSSFGHVSTRNEERQQCCHQPTRELKAKGKCWHSRDLITDEKHSLFINCHQT